MTTLSLSFVLQDAQNLNMAVAADEIATVYARRRDPQDAVPLVAKRSKAQTLPQLPEQRRTLPLPPPMAEEPRVSSEPIRPTQSADSKPLTDEFPAYEPSPQETVMAPTQPPDRKPVDLVEVSLFNGQTMVGFYIRSEREAVVVLFNGEETRVLNSTIKRLKFMAAQPKVEKQRAENNLDRIIDLEPQKDITKQSKPQVPLAPPPQVARVEMYDGTICTGVYRRIDRFSFALVVDGTEKIISDADVRHMALLDEPPVDAGK